MQACASGKELCVLKKLKEKALEDSLVSPLMTADSMEAGPYLSSSPVHVARYS